VAANNAAATATYTTTNTAKISVAGCAASPSVLTAAVDATVLSSNGNTNYGTTTTMSVTSSFGTLQRSFLKFTLPSVPSGCSLTAATLTLTTNSSTNSGSRTFQVYRSATSWTENGVTWNNQPGTTGSAATANPNANVGGTTNWNVLSLVQADYAGTNNGYLIKDSTESGSFTHTFNTREAGSGQPTLTLTWG
jgi:hypothetical protein